VGVGGYWSPSRLGLYTKEGAPEFQAPMFKVLWYLLGSEKMWGFKQNGKKGVYKSKEDLVSLFTL
jgi:hypothetical protein